MLAGVALTASILLSGGLDDGRPFQEWIDARASDSGLKAVSWDTRQLGVDGLDDRVALLCDTSNSSLAWYVIEKSASQRWVIEHDPHEGWVPECTGNQLPDPEWSRSEETTLVIRSELIDWKSETEVALRQGQPAVVSRRQTSDRAGELTDAFHAGADHSESSANWDRLVHRLVLLHGRNRVLDVEGAIIPVLSPDDKAASDNLPPTVNKVLTGEEEWSGTSDASLHVTATTSGSRSEIELEISIQDDVLVAAAHAPRSEQELASVDHLTLIWCRDASQTCSRAAADGAADVRELAIAPLESGALATKWLSKNDRLPLPSVTGTATHVRVSLDRSLLHPSCGVDGCHVPLTVCYSDVDAAQSPQPSLVCTSSLKGHVPRTFGDLFERNDLARYEWVGRKIYANSHLRSTPQ